MTDIKLSKQGISQVYNRGIKIDEKYNIRSQVTTKDVRVRAANSTASIQSAYHQIFGMFDDQYCQDMIIQRYLLK
jgi:hypothetical protein